ncbi:orotate phosphoribosyltransferase [Temperatibacter marinus]|uniref:Orotate phosphoribosyltransferase n=1 Tax=Temperatibacter marinus TaxID=1456591 RepID=A0AA52EE31_9PROT|nr:orotate phosphoribosyltransferase [Temperatibacter marinus]WND01978.1 orotate phosphoribosyltransferase [Temperatibacter marinus]
MNTEDVLNEFRDAGALLEGHFKLSSGKHSSVYCQCALVLKDTWRAMKLSAAFVEKLKATGVDVDMVVSPAMGGVVIGYEVARTLGIPGVFTERVEGQLELRRGFEIPRGAKILMMEDIITTGLSSRECIESIEAAGGHVVAAGCLINRSGGRAEVGVPITALATIDAPIFDPSEVPDELKNIPAVKPGSRGLNK